MFLTRNQIKALTRAERRNKQKRELVAMGIQYAETEAGGIRVLQAEVDRVMLGGSIKKNKEPNFDEING